MATSTATQPTETGVAQLLRPTAAPEVPERQPLLVAKGMTKRFGQVEALVDVDLDLDPGEVIALVADNGAGKSTLIKAISGVQPADAGEISIEGRRVKIRNAQDAYKLGIATVYQGLALCHNLENVYHVADRIVVLRLGRLAASFDRHTTPREEVVAAITGAGATPAP